MPRRGGGYRHQGGRRRTGVSNRGAKAGVAITGAAVFVRPRVIAYRGCQLTNRLIASANSARLSAISVDAAEASVGAGAAGMRP